MNDAWFFVGVFAFIFIIWIATGGPTHPLAFSGPTLALPGELGGGTYLGLPRAAFAVGSQDVSLPGSSGGGYIGSGSGSGSPVPSSSSLSGISFGTPSPYRGIVTLNQYVSNAGASNPNSEYLQLYVSNSAGTPVDVTGWTIESEASGNAIVIPQGTETPTSGTVNAVQDIVLTPGERAVIVSGRSPIGGSFRENKCIGYFSQFQTFTPSLSQNCPTASDELSANYAEYVRDAKCVNYAKTVSRCQAVLTPPPTQSGACQSFVVKYLNYNGCVQEHQNDKDFLGASWHIYLGRTNAMWRKSNEVVKLLDKEGKTVDAFTY